MEYGILVLNDLGSSQRVHVNCTNISSGSIISLVTTLQLNFKERLKFMRNDSSHGLFFSTKIAIIKLLGFLLLRNCWKKYSSTVEVWKNCSHSPLFWWRILNIVSSDLKNVLRQIHRCNWLSRYCIYNPFLFPSCDMCYLQQLILGWRIYILTNILGLSWEYAYQKWGLTLPSWWNPFIGMNKGLVI